MKNRLNKVAALASLVLLAAIPVDVFAADTFKNVLCEAVSLVTSEVGGVIATLAVLTLGFMALIGRVQWSLVIIVVCGIGVVFGAEALITFVSKGSDTPYAGCGTGSGSVVNTN